MKINYTLILLITLFFANHSFAQIRVGDPGVKFDKSLFDENFPQMEKWTTAGVQGGIPWLSSTPIVKTIGPTDSDGLNKAINDVANAGGGQLRLLNGTYTIDKEVTVKSKVRIVGQDRDKVRLKITLKGSNGSAINFPGAQNAGLDLLTIEGGYGVPNDFKMTNAKSNFVVSSVYFNSSSRNCWLNAVTIINSGNHALTIWKGKHHTIRDCYIERAWNKGGGGRGYVQFSGSYCLMYNTTIKKMRHIAIQREGCEYNVFYKNKVEQDFNFHNADKGNNLVEQNTITLPRGLDSGWHGIMGPWASFHDVSERDNFVYKNKNVENNNNGATPFSDPNKIYLGARNKEKKKPFFTSNKVPSGGTLYPVIEEVLSTTDSTLENNIRFYPNPVKSRLHLEVLNSSSGTLELTTLSGQLLLSEPFINGKHELDVSNLSASIYFIKVRTEDNKTAVKKIVVQ